MSAKTPSPRRAKTTPASNTGSFASKTNVETPASLDSERDVFVCECGQILHSLYELDEHRRIEHDGGRGDQVWRIPNAKVYAEPFDETHPSVKEPKPLDLYDPATAADPAWRPDAPDAHLPGTEIPESDDPLPDGLTIAEHPDGTWDVLAADGRPVLGNSRRRRHKTPEDAEQWARVTYPFLLKVRGVADRHFAADHLLPATVCLCGGLLVEDVDDVTGDVVVACDACGRQTSRRRAPRTSRLDACED